VCSSPAAAAFLGGHVVRKLRDKGCAAVFDAPHADYDLRERDEVIRLYRAHAADAS